LGFSRVTIQMLLLMMLYICAIWKRGIYADLFSGQNECKTKQEYIVSQAHDASWPEDKVCLSTFSKSVH